jgi:hypothetical protein
VLLARVLRLIWHTGPAHTLLLIVALVLNGLVPVARLWVARLIINGTMAALRELYRLQAAAYR